VSFSYAVTCMIEDLAKRRELGRTIVIIDFFKKQFFVFAMNL